MTVREPGQFAQCPSKLKGYRTYASVTEAQWTEPTMRLFEGRDLKRNSLITNKLIADSVDGRNHRG